MAAARNGSGHMQATATAQAEPDESSLTKPKSTALLTLGAIGVVFGDIGTSPLYAMKESFVGHHPLAVDPINVFGVLSIVFWSLMLIVTVKYVAIIMRADNKGEGGSLALLALISRRVEAGRWSAGLTMLGIFATALFFGDAMITPAISVLSAVEGLEVINPSFERFVIPAAVAILIGLFMVQRRGTEKVGAIFGPIVLFYFIVLTVLGVQSIVQTPQILGALSPHWAVAFFLRDPHLAFLALGSIVLAVTGAETLYADMGHFGRKPISLAWIAAAFPALMINYLGQGALMLRNPAAAEQPFYLLASGDFLIPLVILATMATIIASQAVITGAFSVISSAVQLGFLPRLKVLHTSETAQGQIYMPMVNWALLGAVLLLVLTFRSSTNLGAAYGIAVTGTMFITTVMMGVVLTQLWNWPKWVALILVALFGLIDALYFTSNLTKIAEGGWFPLLVGLIAFTLLTTWARGRKLVRAKMDDGALPVAVFVKSVAKGIHRVGGTAVYLSSSAQGIPASLLHNLKHNQVLHERILLVTVAVQDVPVWRSKERVLVEDLGCGMQRIILRYGFTEDPDVPAALSEVKELGKLEPMRTSYFISRETILPSDRGGMAQWRERMFAWLVRNSAAPMDYFKLPTNRVVELGSQVEI
jgi:KUP system potassium uptake protein